MGQDLENIVTRVSLTVTKYELWEKTGCRYFYLAPITRRTFISLVMQEKQWMRWNLYLVQHLSTWSTYVIYLNVSVASVTHH